jgi:hypothetical protein
MEGARRRQVFAAASGFYPMEPDHFAL